MSHLTDALEHAILYQGLDVKIGMVTWNQIDVSCRIGEILIVSASGTLTNPASEDHVNHNLGWVKAQYMGNMEGIGHTFRALEEVKSDLDRWKEICPLYRNALRLGWLTLKMEFNNLVL